MSFWRDRQIYLISFSSLWSGADQHGQVLTGVLLFTLCSPGSPGYSIPYTWYPTTICLMCSQQSEHTPGSCGASSPLCPCRGVQSPAVFGGCSMIPLHVCRQQLADTDWSSFCWVEVLLTYPQTLSRQKSVKHTHLLICIVPTFLRAGVDVQLSQAHTAKSQFTLHSCWRCYTCIWDLHIHVCINLSLTKLLLLAHFLSLFCWHIIVLFHLFHDRIFLNRDVTWACIPHRKQLRVFW